MNQNDAYDLHRFVKTSLGERQANILNKVIDVNLDSEDEVMAQVGCYLALWASLIVYVKSSADY